MNTELIKITEEQLNQAYTIINNAYKSGRLSSEEDAELTLSDDTTIVKFTFDSALGLKGAWVLTTDIELIESDYV